MVVEIVPPGQRPEPGPEVTLEDVLQVLIDAALSGSRHIATYPPKSALQNAAADAQFVLARHQALNKIPFETKE